MDGENTTDIRIISEDIRIISEEEIHDFRKEIDACIKKAQGFVNDNFGKVMGANGKRENALVITKLQEAKMWAGKILEKMDATTKENDVEDDDDE